MLAEDDRAASAVARSRSRSPEIRRRIVGIHSIGSCLENERSLFTSAPREKRGKLATFASVVILVAPVIGSRFGSCKRINVIPTKAGSLITYAHRCGDIDKAGDEKRCEENVEEFKRRAANRIERDSRKNEDRHSRFVLVASFRREAESG